MPTAAKLVSAIVFACVAFLAATFYANAIPGGAPPGILPETSAVVGVMCGWFIMGQRAHRTHSRIEAMGTGIRTSFTIVVFVVLIFACIEMMDRAFKGRYDTPMEAILGIFEQAIALAPPLAQPNVLAVLLLGGLFGGAAAHWAGQRWT